MKDDTTKLVTLARDGDEAAAARLLPIVYEELRRLAGHYLGSATPNQTLQPTALVHEAFIRLVDQTAVDYKGKTHFFAAAALSMRHALIDQYRHRNRAKRGGGWHRVTLSAAKAIAGNDQIDLIALDEALTKFMSLDPRAARVVELRFFGGLTEDQVAEVLGVSPRTVRNDWSSARAWLRREVGGEGTVG